MPKSEWLYLFSSNASPQYAQDVLNVLALAPGQEYTFRYGERWVHERAQEEWLSLSDHGGVRVLVCFSLQQQAQFQDACFLPVRLGRAARSEIIGSQYFVTFIVDNYAALPEAHSDDAYREHVRAFRDFLPTRGPVPYDSSATLGKPVVSCSETSGVIDLASSGALLFERSARYLARTESFQDATFLRCESIVARGTETAISIGGEQPAFELNAGKAYDLKLVQSQPSHVGDVHRYSVAVDSTMVQIIGASGFDIASSYDQVRIQFVAVAPDQPEVRESAIIVEPESPGQGPRLELPVRIRPPIKRSIGKATVTTLALALIGVQAVLNISQPLSIGLVFIGAITVAWMQVFGLSVPDIPAFPDGK
ncbi:MAG TPA: hypothetical protein VMI13_13250 [Solirubrobacteraceae bacterium]|nr:hypothetical protein [Solirubrobacteraceae bacterium]